jgi:hypothetical protein
MGVRVEVLDEPEPNGLVGQYVFKTRLGRIVGRRHVKNGVYRIWLAFPREHAFNPIFWFADFLLSSRIEDMLRCNGAQPCDWDFDC